MADTQIQDDWRWLGTRLTSPYLSNGKVSASDEIVRMSIPVTVSGKQISVPVPSVSACLLNLAIQQWTDAETLRIQVEKNANSISHMTSQNMDLFGDVMASAVLAYASLESFANLLIPHNAQWINPKKKRGIFAVLFKSKLERESTETKLGDALPMLLDYESPKGKKIWQRFKLLKDHRDRIVHCKSADQLPEVTDNHLWGIWIANDCPDYPDTAWKMIDYISTRIDTSPLWVHQFRSEKKIFFDNLKQKEKK